MRLDLHNMGQEGEHIRVDVYLEDGYVGGISLRPGEWEKLQSAHDDGEVVLEVRA